MEEAEQPHGECHDKEGSHAHHHQLSNNTDAEAAADAAGQNNNKAGTPRDNGQSVTERHTTKSQCGDNNNDRVNHAMRITGQQRDGQQRDGQQRDGQLSPRRDDEVHGPSQQPPCTAQGGETRTRGACLGDVDGGGEKPPDKQLPDIKGETADAKSRRWETGVPEGDCSDSSDTTGDEEEVDPRVAENLEIMNQCCSDVNRLENELDEARSKYRSTFQASSQRMEELAIKIKRSIQRARPYFELSEKAKEAQNEATRAARQYQTANGNYRAAKEMMTLAEQGVDNSSSTCSLSTAWQETLNHATDRVMESEREKTRSEAEHNRRAAIFAELDTRLHYLEKKYKRSIAKARPYFETKAELELKLQQLKQNVWDLQQAISTRKTRYSEALRRLEAVSMEIHECRRSRQKMLLQFPREPGVGAESDSLCSSISDVNIERGVFSSTASFDGDDESDDSADVFSQGSLEHARHERAPCRTPRSQRATDDRPQSDSSASAGSVFSSEGAAWDSVPQSPTSASSGASVPAAVSTPAPASALAGGFPETSNPSPGAVGAGPRVAAIECASSGCPPGRVAVAAPVEGRSRDALGARETAPQRNVGAAAATERGTAAADAVLQKKTKEKEQEEEEEKEKSLEPVVVQDQREAGDGSAHDDRPRGEGGKEEEEEEKGRSGETLPVHATDDDPHQCAVGSTVPSLQHPRGGAARDDGNSRVTCPGSPSFLSQGGGGRIPGVAADSEPRQRSHSFNEIWSKAAGGGQVTKQPLRRPDAKHKALQGVMLLNPMHLAASSSSLPF